MLRSMYSAISGMQGFETKLDVIGNNIANVNTPGFKAGRVDFSDVLSQTMTGGSAPGKTIGGTNPQQVGLGMKVGAIQTLFTQGFDQSTGNNLDLSIDGAGLFVVQPSTGGEMYTRAGNFNVDSGNNLVLPDGSIAMGYAYRNAGGTPATLTLDTSKHIPVNLDTMLKDFVQSLPGTSVDGGANTYSSAPGSVTTTTTSSGTVYGIAMTGGSAGNPSANPPTPPTNYRTFTLPTSPDLQIGQDGSLNVTVQVTDYDATGNPTTSNQKISIGSLTFASVPNPAGLEKVGNSMYTTSNNSGKVTYSTPGQNNTGAVQAGYLEMSNVDLTREFTEMIVAQRGFDANSKMIGTDNSILQDIVNLKNG